MSTPYGNDPSGFAAPHAEAGSDAYGGNPYGTAPQNPYPAMQSPYPAVQNPYAASNPYAAAGWDPVDLLTEGS